MNVENWPICREVTMTRTTNIILSGPRYYHQFTRPNRFAVSVEVHYVKPIFLCIYCAHQFIVAYSDMERIQQF